LSQLPLQPATVIETADEQIEVNSMTRKRRIYAPIFLYLMHEEARLSKKQKEVIMDWALQTKNSLEAAQ